MAKRRSTKSKQTTPIIVVIIFLIALGAYLVTGSDPLGLFDSIEAPTPTPPQESTGGDDGDWWQVYFTDPQNHNDPNNLNGTIAEALMTHINEAQDTIHIASFEFNLTPVAEALIAAHERGVEVLWVTDDEHGIEADEDEGHGQFAMLEEAGIEIHDDGRSALMHNKFWLFDRQIVWTGSTNITVNGIFHNNNNVIVVRSPDVAAIYEREFDELWAGEFGPTSPSTLDSQQATVNGTPIRVLFAAEDEAADELVPLIRDAQQSIRVMAFSFTHDEIGDAVLARAQGGVDIRGIFETRGSETEFSELTKFFCAAIPVRQDGNPRTFHHKVLVIDDQIVVTGSLNFSNNANDSNDENVLIITHDEIAALYLQEFERRWAEGSEPDQADMTCQ